MKKAPYIFLLVLFIVLVFIVGVRYGQQVEQTNKSVSYTLSIAPTRPAPTASPFGLKKYSHSGCGISITYPTNLHLDKESSRSARFTMRDAPMLEFNCQASPSAVPRAMHFERRFNPLTGRNVYLLVNKSLIPILESLKFSLR